VDQVIKLNGIDLARAKSPEALRDPLE